MPIAKSTMAESIQAGVGKTAQDQEKGGFGGVFKVTCFDVNGNLKWEEAFDNLVVNVGLALSLNGALTNTAKGATFMGLKGTGTVLAADTMGSHAGWAELITYKLVNVSGAAQRSAPSFTTTSTTSISPTAAQVFFATGTMDVAGCFISVGGTATFGDNSGVLFSAGNFTGGTKSVVNTDTLSVSYTATATSS